MDLAKTTLTAEQYTVAWLCALPESEQVAARLVLDEWHEDPPRDFDDINSYFFGSIGGHNIVIGCLPPGQPGLVSASSLVEPMSRSFKNLKIYLFVGIGGGIPHNPPCEDADDDVHLGDVVVGYSEQIGAPAVIQWDFGRRGEGDKYENTSNLDKPDRRLLSALGSVVTNHECGNTKFEFHLEKIITKNPKFKHPGLNNDKLFDATYQHGDFKDCSKCSVQELVSRPSRDSTKLIYHRGTIVSGNSVMKNGTERDKISKMNYNARCIEMEAAGVIDKTRCLVIRGIADYADGHKNRIWHRYAAGAAAAFGKEFLLTLKPVVLDLLEPKVPQLELIQEIVSQVKVVVDKQESHYLNDQQRKCHLVFKSSTYEQFKNSNPERVPGTCLWALEHPQYKQWLESQEHNLLWISADPGCGKSVLSRSLVENDLYHTNSRFVCYFFFKDNEQQDRLNIALCALLHQLFDQQPQLLKHAMPEWQKNGEKLREETERLWSILLNAAAGSDSCDIICVLDALDECQESDRRILVRKLSNFYKECSSKRLRGKSLKFLVTSRPYDDIVSGFRDIPQYLPTIRLSGEDENKRIHQEIDIVIQERVRRLAIDMPLSDSTAISLEQSLLKMEHRTYLWLYLAFHSIEEQYRDRLFPDSESIVSLQLPKSVEDAYEKILSKITKNQKPVALKILHIIVGAYRPLTIAEMAIALGLAELPNSQAYAEFRITINLETYIRRLCGLFVFVKDSKIYLLHQTAKEFLCQKQPERASSGWKHCLNPIDSETTMTRICIAYLALKEVGQIKYKFDLLNLKVEISEPKHGIGAFLEYSAIHWPSHFRNSAVEIENMVAKACSLYRKECLDLWFPILLKARRHYQSPIDMNNVLLAAFNGHDVILRDFLKTGITNLEEHDTTGRTALIWAAELGFIKVVKILLDKKADFNTQGGDYGNALQAASAKGHQAVIELLLEKGANINTQEGNYSNALQIASINGHQAVVELLLEKGANINIRGGDYGNALQAASVGGYQAVVELLLEKGANINARGGNYGNALQGASAQGHQAVIELLLEKGANINARGGDYGNALQAASAGGYQAAVKLFLAKGADVNAKGGIYRNDSLQMASANGHQAVVELLLANGANFNAQAEGGNYDNALQAASINGHQAVVELLLAKGANINARGGDYGNALQAASANGHQAIVKLLLAKGADINAQGGVYGNAFNAASMEGHQIVAQLLQEEQISKLKLKEKISAIVFFYLFFWFLFCS